MKKFIIGLVAIVLMVGAFVWFVSLFKMPTEEGQAEYKKNKDLSYSAYLYCQNLIRLEDNTFQFSIFPNKTYRFKNHKYIIHLQGTSSGKILKFVCTAKLKSGNDWDFANWELIQFRTK